MIRRNIEFIAVVIVPVASTLAAVFVTFPGAI